LKLPRSIFTVAEKKQSKAVISFEEWNWKSCSVALQFRTPKAVKCLHTFEIQNTANVVARDETAIYDYSSVRICLNANIPIATFLFINRWCKVKKTSLMRGRGIPIHKHSTKGSTF
jgi:hypothetical protein